MNQSGRALDLPTHRGARGAARQAFTLIEIVVVLTIVLILSAMLFPVIETALSRAESTSCLSNMRNLGLAVRLYCDDYDEVLIPAMLPHPACYGICWDVTLQAYVRNRGLLLCPTDEYPRTVLGTLSEPHSYGINLELTEVGGYMASSLAMFSIEEPAATILFCELEGQRFATHGVRYSTGGLERVAGRRHGNGSNYTFVDGHAKWLQPEATERPELLWDP
ncbi:MAG: prepilin-type N-terminal cleavage/methylation domain-containing protein [candidate division WS1 bacterium]|nr:prepilin-type N-terminal cleavage/methylation domain-containing protein [candidate division WS1 bacterium]